MITGNSGKRPQVSIIIATYNAGAHLARCLESVRNQSYPNYEVVIVDGFSTDNTMSIIENNSDIVSAWVTEPDQGIYDALNKGVKMAVGQWIYFLGADDILFEGFSEMANKLKDINTLYYGYCVQDDKIMGTSFTGYQLAKMNVCHHAIFYPSLVFRKYSYRPEYKVFADYLLNMQCWGDRSIKKEYYSVLIAGFQSGGFSFTYRDDLFKQHKPMYVKKYLGWLVYIRYLNRIRKERRKGNWEFF